MRVAVYLRVSKGDDSQTTENQRLQLQKFVEEQRWEVFHWYEDHDTGGRGADHRAQFRELLEDARKRKFDVVLFWALDRLTREGAFKTLTYLTNLSDWGIAYTSYTERFLDTCGIFKEAVISILATIAKQERIRISERVQAGMQRAKARGVKIGRRPVTSRVDMEYFRRAVRVYSISELCQRFHLGKSTVFRLRGEVFAEDRRREAEELGDIIPPAETYLPNHAKGTKPLPVMES